jgi:hypothetical protein
MAITDATCAQAVILLAGILILIGGICIGRISKWWSKD